ncbi:DUF2339 domain-containing protein [Capnocytophaga canimorsus]|uniref:DUF2339 domain-containing protein n=1 Tax=Capnocytophaga canimorsus TaxID=28188 RepID=UPI0037D7C48C
MASEKEIQALQEKLRELLKRQELFMAEINEIRQVLDSMLNQTGKYSQEEQVHFNDAQLEVFEPKTVTKPVLEEELSPLQATEQKKGWSFKDPEVFEREQRQKKHPQDTLFSPPLPKTQNSLERFLGENLLNKVGIFVLIIGVFIGVKYSIDNNLISPLMRVVLGYVTGTLLLVFGFKLKAKYGAFSAVLVSGALTIFYFITYIAFDFYNLFPRVLAFVMMFSFTAFAVVSALNYNRQLIALLGLVGGYAVPFLLSDGSGNIPILFTYVAIINIGIMIIFIFKKWRILQITAFSLTWLMYLIARGGYYQEQYLHTYYLFCLVYFLIFHIPLLIGIKKKDYVFGWTDLVLMLCNSILVFLLGYSLLSGNTPNSSISLGFFTLANALFHFLLAVFLRSKDLKNNMYYLSIILALGFATIVLPIMADGFVVTLFWATQAALLFWVARHKKVPFYEWLFYPLMLITFFSLLHDREVYNLIYFERYIEEKSSYIQPFLNVYLPTSLFVVALLAFAWYINRKYTHERYTKPLSYVFGGSCFLLLYLVFYQEIGYYWDFNFYNDEDKYWQYNYFKKLWLINYTLFFVASFILLVIRKIRQETIGYIALSVGFLSAFVFLTFGLYAISELRESYLFSEEIGYADADMMHLYIRYISLAFFAYLLFALRALLQSNLLSFIRLPFFALVLHITILWVVSSELLHWTQMYQQTNNYKLGISILWGVYAVFMVVLGLFKRRRYVRLGGIALFGVTLLKLFFYDIANLTTIAKTIVFISLGVLLLLASFLYNKYTNRIEAEEEK